MISIRKHALKLALPILIFLLFVTTLTSCIYSQKILPKEDILASVERVENEGGHDYTFVAEYLELFGLPMFDTEKVAWAERVFYTYYNYDHGTDLSFNYEKGDSLPLAASVARYFLNEYYDVIDLKDKDAVTTAVIDSYVRVSNDPYAIYRLPEASDGFQSDMSGTYAGIGVVVEYNHSEQTIMVATVFPDSPAEKAGLQVGDFFYAVDGMPVSDIGYLKAIEKVRGEIGTDVAITVLRDGVKIELVATRAKITEKSIEYEMLEGNIGYIKITTFKDNTDEQFKAAVDTLLGDGAKGIVFDLRDNTGGYLDTVVNMLSYILPNGKDILSYQFKHQIKTTLVTREDVSSANQTFDSVIDLPLAVLCNEYTASAAEIFTAVVRDYKNSGDLEAVLVGEKTYGKGIMQSTVPHPDGSSITLTVAYYNPPSDVNYHGIGITPDLEVTDTQQQLSVALSELNKFISCTGPDAAHVFENYVSNNNASCEKDGTKSATCIFCGIVDIKSDPNTKLSHEFAEYVYDENATCTADGTESAKCERCDATDKRVVLDSKLGHSFGEYTSDRNVTFTQDGTKSARCNACGAIDTVVDVDSHYNKKQLINDAISESLENGLDTRTRVFNYLVDWGFPSFDTAKVRWAEQVFLNHYNYNHGTDLSFNYNYGDVLPLAAAVAQRFLDEYCDIIDTTDIAAVTTAVIDSYLDVSGDPYAVYRLPEANDDFQSDMSGEFGGIGVILEYDHQNETVMVSTVFENSPAHIAGLKFGDYIYAVDGTLLSDMGYLNTTYKIRGEIGTEVKITVLRDGELITLTAIRNTVVEKSVNYKLLDGGIAYVEITTFKANTLDQFKEAVDALVAGGAVGIVFDLRNNTGGYLDTVAKMLSYLLPSGKSIVTYQVKNGTKYNLTTSADGYTETGEVIDSVIDLPMAVICNGYTASAAEIFTSVIRDYRNTRLLDAVIVGEVTFGKGIMQASSKYTDGSTITLTTAYYLPPLGVSYHGIGITPDVIVEPTDDVDNQLDAAISNLKTLLNDN